MHIWKFQYFYRKRQRYRRISFSAAAQKAAALFVSTYFYLFSLKSAKCPFERIPETKQVRALFISADRSSLTNTVVVESSPRCRLNTPPETVPLDRTNGAAKPLKWCMITAAMVH